MITPTCDMCNRELNLFGAIVLSPPDITNRVTKHHVCVQCYSGRIDPLLSAAPTPPEVEYHKRATKSVVDNKSENTLLKPEDFDTPKPEDIADLLDDHAISDGHPEDWPYATLLMQEAARLIRALQTPPEVEPVGIVTRHDGVVGALMQQRISLKVGDKLYASPPSPKAEWDSDGNPLNLEAAARDLYDWWHKDGGDINTILDNIRKFLPEGK